jgi:DNA-binding NarL/FixJ family response regulator
MAYTILIVEDEAILSEAYVMILKKEGFKTITAFDGREALKAVDEKPIDLILLDLRMPHMNGLEFLKVLHKKQINIPKTIVFSNYDVQKDIDETYKYGATRYMLKAWASPKELVKVVEDTLSN